MDTKKAIMKRIEDLCSERDITLSALAYMAGMDNSTIYSIMSDRSQNPGVVTLKKMCDGLDISLREFFNDEMFDNLDQEIK